VVKAQQEKERSIIQAQGEAQSARLIGEAISQNPAFLTLRRIEAAREVGLRLRDSGRWLGSGAAGSFALLLLFALGGCVNKTPRPSFSRLPAQIADTVANAQNRVYLSSESLLLGVGTGDNGAGGKR